MTGCPPQNLIRTNLIGDFERLAIACGAWDADQRIIREPPSGESRNFTALLLEGIALRNQIAVPESSERVSDRETRLWYNINKPGRLIMYALSASIEVNPAGATPILSHEQVWSGLVMKAENAVPFVPGMQACKVLERYADGLLREIVIGSGDRFKETITFTPPIQVLFERVDTDEHAGWITNVISESERGLMLTFTFAVNFPGVQPGSESEKQQGQQMKSSYVKAVEATLKEVRRLASEGKLSNK